MHHKSVNSVQFVPFSNSLVSASEDATVKLWDARTKCCAQTYAGHRAPVNNAASNLSGTMIGSCDSDGWLNVWDVRRRDPLMSCQFGSESLNQVAFDSTSALMAIASDSGCIDLWELKSGRDCVMRDHKDGVQSVLFDPMGEYLVSADDSGEMHLYT